MSRITKVDRQRVLRELLRRNSVHAQGDLLDLLHSEGIETTPATLSRDLRDIGATKHRDGYRIEKTERDLRKQQKAMTAALRGLIERLDRGGNLLVLHTAPGHGAPVAMEIERHGLPEVMGAIAGVDTVFVAARTAIHARELERVLSKAVRSG